MRLVSGGLIECLVSAPCDALRIALLIKNGIKSFSIYPSSEFLASAKYRKQFQAYGARVGISIGRVNIDLIDKDIVDEEAISRSGKLIAEQKKMKAKSTLSFDSPSKDLTDQITVILSLLDEFLNRATTKQSHILLYKLLGYNEVDIARELGIKQSTVNQQSKAAGWNVIEQAVRYYSQYDFFGEFNYKNYWEEDDIE
ncbi:hypothetical protein JCM10512_4717 [Bacteroides reticulotermitis JCM 10512]|uniref:Uncharacterized protein n=2 Tax=Bacteroides reticulotermitis TaxID=1133319 RepID=W4UZF8_9BACE|nr:hypothetical protein JCM10512_4717 [Bacteroides reticulotermitis JCM 10512]